MKTCPYCRKTFPPDKDQKVEPNDGDVMLCTRCGELGIFDSGGLRKPNDAEMKKLRATPELNALRDRWRRMQ